MDKRYQVFVSSTYEDLREERAEVIQALLELDCIPAGMELFPAGDDEQWTVIQRVIDECDYYIVIIAGRYGSIGPDGKSYTQMEYEYAVSRGKPVMAFLHENPGSIPVQKSEQDFACREALQNFRELAKKKLCRFWSTPKDLSGVVSRGIAHMKQNRPGVGWVRGDLVPDETAAQEILRLQKEISVLQAKIGDLASHPPVGTEGLAQGDETVWLQFTFEVPRQNDVIRRPLQFSWNELLSVLGPIMLDSANEQRMKNKLIEVFKNRIYDKDRVAAYNCEIRDEDFQKIKVQLRALGLIVRAERQGVYSSWTLTPYGDNVMTQIAAIRSGTAESAPLASRDE